MTIDRLLEGLIDIAKKPKTDFALFLNMTPSGLSKILTGKRVPSMKERKNFTQQTASYFAESIYCYGCHLKFEHLFPIIYEFESLEKLRAFLISAITYALDGAFIQEAGLNLSFANRGMYYWGRKPVLNQLCIILSNYAVSFPDHPLEIFLSLPLHDPVYSKLFKKMLLIGRKKSCKVVLHYYYDDGIQSDSSNMNAVRLLLLISELEKYFDLNFYKVDKSSNNFMLLKGKCLLLFNKQMDGTPFLLPVIHKSYLSIFYDTLMKKNGKRVSYYPSQAMEFLEKNTDFIPNLIERGIDSVFNFIPLGYLLNKEDLDAVPHHPVICDAILNLFGSILSQQPAFIISSKTMENLMLHKKVIAPLIGTISFPGEQCAAYMKRFSTYLPHRNYDNLKVIDYEISNISALFSQDMCLIYTIDDTLTYEKIHVFHSIHLGQQLYQELVEKDCLLINFSPELWETFQDRLLSTANEFHA